MKTWIEISRKNLLHNAREFQKLLGEKVIFMAVVKANAYGHGLTQVSRILANNPKTSKNLWFGVDNVDEGVILRRQKIQQPILILGYTPLNRLREAISRNLRLTVYNTETIKALSAIKNTRQKARVHIKVETGITRQGVPEEALLKFAKLILRSKKIQLEGLSTHFANIEDVSNSYYSKIQLKRFKRAVWLLEKNGISVPIKHSACSAAALLFPETRFNLARIGISLYGLWPSTLVFASALERAQTKIGENPYKMPDLWPVMTWKTKIAQIKRVSRGTSVSYGLTERVRRDSLIAVMPVGYSDGYDRKLSSMGHVLIRGRRAKVLGRVCMNMFMVDVTDIPGVKIENEAMLLGRGTKEMIAPEELASQIGTIHYEILARINPLIPRLVV